MSFRSRIFSDFQVYFQILSNCFRILLYLLIWILPDASEISRILSDSFGFSQTIIDFSQIFWNLARLSRNLVEFFSDSFRILSDSAGISLEFGQVFIRSFRKLVRFSRILSDHFLFPEFLGILSDFSQIFSNYLGLVRNLSDPFKI